MVTMEDLTKTQIILLTLLVSFVTSIATGIITVSLLAEAPTSVTQTINRVVERTIETVAPASPTSSGTKEVTVVKEEDAIISSIDKSAQSIVRIKSPFDPAGSQTFYALGVIVSKDGLVVSDKRDLILPGTYTVVLSDGSVLTATVKYVDDINNLVTFQIKPDSTHSSFSAITLSKNDLKLGQSAIAVEGKDKNTVGIGRATALNTSTVVTDIGPVGEIQGSPLLNLSGELVGLKSSNIDLTLLPGVYTSLGPIKKAIENSK